MLTRLSKRDNQYKYFSLPENDEKRDRGENAPASEKL